MDREPRPRPESPRPESPRTEASVQAGLIARTMRALAELESVAREVVQAERSLAPEAHLTSVAVPLALPLEHDGPRRERALDLLRYLHEQIRESLLAGAAFKRGRVYCLRCDSTACAHALPPGPRMVFAGYGETGRPEWVEIAELLAARHDPRLDRVYTGTHELVAIAISQDEIYERLLPVFSRGRDRYLVLAQICVGRFLPDGSPPNGELMSLTVQAVQITMASSQTVVGLNLIGRPPDDAHLPLPLADSVLEGLADALRAVRRELSSLAPEPHRCVDRRPGRPAPRLADHCLARLRDACRDLEHRTRVAGKRTRHAAQRARQANRPTAKAFEDARQARDADLFEDAREHTIVVLGARGRVHFFTKDGKHVSSVMFPAPAIRGRIAQRRWRVLSREALLEFRRRTEA